MRGGGREVGGRVERREGKGRRVGEMSEGQEREREEK